jgi:hypothetical protein
LCENVGPAPILHLCKCLLTNIHPLRLPCRPLSKVDLQDEGEAYKAWTRLTHVNFVGLILFLVYLLVAGGYLYTRWRYSVRGLGQVQGYGVFVLVIETLSILSLIFYGIWLCAKTDQGDVRAVDAESNELRRLYVIRVLVLCKDESLATVRRTISSVKNAYPTEGCERKIYLLDESKDDAKRDYFMSAKSGTDVIYIAPPARPDGSRVCAFSLFSCHETCAVCARPISG